MLNVKNAILTVCPCGCPRDYSPVCGTDGKTYGNECVMECESCKQGTDVTVASQGECTEARSRLSNSLF